MLRELDVLRVCALLHDIGKLECWANRKPWSDHIHWTYRFVRECLGEEYAWISMRHHTGLSYAREYHPQSEIERVICLADNFSSGADRREEPKHGAPRPTPPIILTHVLSDGSVVRSSFDATRLAYVSNVLRQKIRDSAMPFSGEAYIKIFNLLGTSDLREIPADTRKPINDVSLWNHLKLTAAFATCIWIEGYKGDDYSKYDFALLSGDADRISSYINVSRRLPDLNARSQRIKEATEKAAATIAEKLGPECIIYKGGGSFLALSPKNTAESVLEEAKRAFEHGTFGEVTMTVSHIVVNGAEVMDDFGGCWEKAQREMHIKKDEREAPLGSSVEEGVEVCDVCRSRKYSREDCLKILRIDASPRPERLCEPCWKLREEGKGIELDELRKKTNYVAVLKADGDDMGKVLRGDNFKRLGKASTPSRLSTVSDLINLTCEEKLNRVVERYGGKCLYAGGDDVLAFVTGENAFEAAIALASTFKEEMIGECTMSVGIAIFRFDLPVYVGLEIVNYLLERAKEDGKNRVAYTVVGGAGISKSELKELVKPKSWSELIKVMDNVRFIGKGGVAASQVRKIAELAHRKPEEAEVFVKYLMGKGTISWERGEELLGFLKSGTFHEAFIIHNFFRGI